MNRNKQKTTFWPFQSHTCKQLEYKAGQEKGKLQITSKYTDFVVQPESNNFSETVNLQLIVRTKPNKPNQK